MQLHYFVLLAAAIAFHGVDALVSTNSKPTQAISLAVEEEDVLVKRLLRSHDEEERGLVPGWVKGLFKSDGYTKLSKTLSSGEKEKLAKQLSMKSKSNGISAIDDLPEHLQKFKGKTVDEAFDIQDFSKVDNFFSKTEDVSRISVEKTEKFFASKQFVDWLAYIAHNNMGSRNKQASVASSIRDQFGDKKAARLFASAIASPNVNLSEAGKAFQRDLMKQWTKTNPMKTPEEVAATISTSLARKYKNVYDNAIAEQKAAVAKFLPNRVAGNAANGATRV